MSAEETLHDVTIRVQQLEAYILRSPEYLKRADQELKRQVTILYLAIALLLVFQGLFTLREAGHLPMSGMVLMSVTSFLAIVNCLLLIHTKTWLHRLNQRPGLDRRKKSRSLLYDPSAVQFSRASDACPRRG